MNIKKLTLTSSDYPALLKQLKPPPQQIYHMGASLSELFSRPAVTIVGTRKLSPYGEQVTRDFAGKLAEQGVVIVSGLAFGVDAVAHEAALEAGGLCVAVLPTPLDNIVPVSNRYLAHTILESGGALVSEYASGQPAGKQNFIARNRIMSGLTPLTLITEAGEKSGSIHTANFAVQQDRQVLAVPGNIYHQGSQGINKLLTSNTAGVASCLEDVLHALNLTSHTTVVKQVKGRNANEQNLLDLMLRGISAGDVLFKESGLEISKFNHALTMLEISGKIRPLGANHWAIT
jgi:DNA processing protein